MEQDSIDVGVVGDGEEVFLELVQAFEAGRTFDGIPGTWTRVNGVPTAAAPRDPPDDLDALPWPARELFPVHLYRAITIRRPFATMTTSFHPSTLNSFSNAALSMTFSAAIFLTRGIDQDVLSPTSAMRPRFPPSS